MQSHYCFGIGIYSSGYGIGMGNDWNIVLYNIILRGLDGLFDENSEFNYPDMCNERRVARYGDDRNRIDGSAGAVYRDADT